MTTPQGDEPHDHGDRDETDATNDVATNDVAPDDIFLAAIGASDRDGPDRGDQPPAAGDAPAEEPAIETEMSAGTSVYPAGPPDPKPPTAPVPVWGTPRLPPPGGQNFERRTTRPGPGPDEHGYYPDDYYLPTDWPRLLAKVVVAAVLLVALAVAGFEISDRFERSDDDETSVDPTPTPLAEVAVYECAGDPDPVAQQPPPGSLLIVGRTADSGWLAFRNPEAPPLQLWVEARDVPTFIPSTVGIVSCATAPDEFPTPR